MFKRMKRLELLKAIVEKALTEQPKHWGFRIDADEHEGGIVDGVTYSATDLDKRPDFVKKDDAGWTKSG